MRSQKGGKHGNNALFGVFFRNRDVGQPESEGARLAILENRQFFDYGLCLTEKAFQGFSFSLRHSSRTSDRPRGRSSQDGDPLDLSNLWDPDSSWTWFPDEKPRTFSGMFEVSWR